MSSASNESDAPIPGGRHDDPVAPATVGKDQSSRDDDVISQVPDIENQIASFTELLRKQAIMQLEIRRQQAAVAERDAQAAKREQELETLRAQAVARANELESLRKALDNREVELLARNEQLEASLAAAKSAREEAARQCEATAARLAAQTAAQENALAARRAEVAALESAAGSRAKELDDRAKDLTRRQSDADEKLARAKAAQDGAAKRLADLTETERRLVQQTARLAEDRETLARDTTALAQARKEVAEQEHNLVRAALVADESRNRLRESGDEIEKARLAHQARLDDLDRRAAQIVEQEAAIRDRLAVAESAEAAGSERVDPGNPQSAGAFLEVIEEYEQLWQLELAHAADFAGAAQGAIAENSELGSIIEDLKARLQSGQEAQRASAEQIAALEASLAASKAEDEQAPRPMGGGRFSSPASESVARRRRRLKKYKDLVRQQAIKVRKASDALKKRYEQAEQILSQRESLAAARVKVIQAQNAEQRRSATSRAAVLVVCALTVLALVGGIAWAIAREVAPAKFEATTILKAESKERELNAGELAEWQRLHEGLLEDPRVNEALAERFKRQGIVSLSTAAQVAEMARTQITSESGGDGELKLRLVGQGAAPTGRILEIYTNGLANYVNSGSIRRVDGANTAIAQPATVGSTPIDSLRTQYALAIACVGTVLSLALGFAIWRRLASAKTAFEKDMDLARALE